MAEYKHTVSKIGLRGSAENPPQDIGNAGSPLLNQNLTVQNGIGIALVAGYGKQIYQAGQTAVIDKIGDDRLNEVVAGVKKAGGYIAIGATLGVIGVGVALAAEAVTFGIQTAQERHTLKIDNAITTNNRGTRVNLGGGGYYD